MAETVTSPPILDMDPYSEAVLADPYNFFEALRETGPVVELPRYGVYAVGRHELAATVLGDLDRFTTIAGIGLQDIRVPGSGARAASAILEVEPPVHTAVRSALRGVLSPAVINAVKTEAKASADRIVSEALTKSEVDAVEDITEPFVSTVFEKTFGIRLDKEGSRALSAMAFNQTGPHGELFQKSVAAAQPYLAAWEEVVKPENVLPGSVADLIYKAEEAGKFAPGVGKVLNNAFARGGTDTTISSLSTMIDQLARNPEQWAYLKANPGKIKSAYEEALRFDSPFHVVYRLVVAPTELDGVHLEGGRKIGVFFGAANRDPRKWADPAAYSTARELPGSHLSFGIGRHNCIGAMIARVEGEALLSSLVEKVDKLEATGATTFKCIQQLRIAEHIPVRLTAAA